MGPGCAGLLYCVSSVPGGGHAWLSHRIRFPRPRAPARLLGCADPAGHRQLPHLRYASAVRSSSTPMSSSKRPPPPSIATWACSNPASPSPLSVPPMKSSPTPPGRDQFPVDILPNRLRHQHQHERQRSPRLPARTGTLWRPPGGDKPSGASQRPRQYGANPPTTRSPHPCRSCGCHRDKPARRPYSIPALSLPSGTNPRSYGPSPSKPEERILQDATPDFVWASSSLCLCIKQMAQGPWTTCDNRHGPVAEGIAPWSVTAVGTGINTHREFAARVCQTLILFTVGGGAALTTKVFTETAGAIFRPNRRLERSWQ